MASLLQGIKNLKANLGTAAHELQHVANLFQPGASADEKKFLEAVYGQQPQLAAQLLSQNPNVIFARTKDWHNAWHIAAASGSLPMLEVLHTHGRGATRKPLPGEPPHYAARTRDKRETPLMLACANDHLAAMQYLLGVGASILDGDKYGNTIVHYGALKGQVKLLAILLAADEGENGGNPDKERTRLVDARNEAGLQPLHFAVWGGNPEAVRVLLDYKPDLVAKSISDSMAQVTCNGGSTPLHVAALRSDAAMIDLLLQEYVKVTLEGRGPRSDPRTVTDNYQFTAQGLAKDLGRDKVVNVLDPIKVLKGLEPGAVAAAAAARERELTSRNSMRRSTTSGRSSHDGAGSTTGPSASDLFDGFAQLAAGHGEKKSPQKVPVPVLPPPPAKAGKAVAASVLQVLVPPPQHHPGSPIHPADAAATSSASTPTLHSPTRPGSGKAGDKFSSPVRPPLPRPGAGTPTARSPSTAGKLQSTPRSSGGGTLPPDAPATSEASAGAGIPAHPPATAAQGAAGGSSGSESASALERELTLSSSLSQGLPPPEQYVCPITSQLMSHPVIAGDGRAYEADAIQMWLSLGNEYFPGGTVKVLSTELVPTNTLRAEIQDWKSKRSKKPA